MRPVGAPPAAVAVGRAGRAATGAQCGPRLVLAAAVGKDPRPAIGVEDGTEPADALRRVPAAPGVEAHVDGVTRVALACRRGVSHRWGARTSDACFRAPGRGTRCGRRCSCARTGRTAGSTSPECALRTAPCG